MAAAAQEPPHTGSGGEEIPRYPPFLKGLPLPPLALLMATQSDLIARLRRELALGEDENGADRWETFVQPVIARYAAFVHLIPASETHHHRGAGGLYRHGLEAAFHAARASRGVMVGLDRPRTEQRRLEPRLRVAAALGGLLHDAGKAIHDVSATDRAGRWTWSPIDADLGEWAAEHGIQRYFLHWREQRAHGGHAVFNVIALKRILPTRVERWLSEPDPRLYTGLVAAITGMAHSSALVELVRNADRHSVERDLREHRIESIDTAVGVPVDRYLVDAMRRLIHDGRWQVNVPGARVWLLRDAGLHLVWPAAARDITELLTTDRVPGIPRDPDTIAELLLERGLAVPRVDALGRHSTWRLAPALLARAGGKPVSLNMLRLKDLGLLFPSGGPTAVAVMSSADADGQSLPLPVAAGSQPQRSDANADADLAHGATSMAPSIGDAASAPDPAPSGDVASRTDAGADVINADYPSDQAEATDAASDTQQDADDRTALNEARTWLLALSDSSERLLAAFGDQPATRTDTLAWHDGLLWLRYPEWFVAVGWEPAQAAEALSADRLIEPDPKTPMRRVREHAGQRWLVLNAGVSARLRILIGAAPGASRAPTQQTAAEDRGAATASRPDDPDTSANPGVGSDSGTDGISLPVAVIQALTEQHGPGNGSRVHVLDQSALKTLAKRHGLGVYTLRERLLTDPRFHEDAHRRLAVTL